MIVTAAFGHFPAMVVAFFTTHSGTMPGKKQPLEPLEAQLAAVIVEHPECVQWLEAGDATLAAEFTRSDAPGSGSNTKRTWDRQLVDILACVPVYGLEAVASACNAALGSGSVSRDVVINLPTRTQQEPSAQAMDIPAHLQLKQPPLADYGRYDRFRQEPAHATR